MFKLIKSGATALFTLLCIATLSRCVKDNFSNEELGAFSLSIAADDVLVETTTKSNSNIDISSFKVAISTIDGSQILKEWEKYSEVPEIVKFSKGNYLIKAFSGDSTITNFDAASFSGSSKLSVYKSDPQNVSVLCKLNKMVVTVKLEENMKLYYSDLSTEVSASTKSKLTYTKDELRRGYFPVNPLSAKLYLTRKDGSQFEATMPQIQNTKAGEHYIISFNTKNGIGTVTVSVKEAISNEIIVESIIPTEATTNLPPYFVASNGFTLESPVVSINETGIADVRMLIKARGYIKKCIIGIKSSYLISKGVPSQFDLTTTSTNSDLSAILKSVGLVWSNNMSSSTIAEIDFSGMMSLLPANNDNNYDHVISLKVEDNYQRFSDKLDLRLSVSNPIIEIETVSRIAEVNNVAEVDLKCSIENGSFTNLERVEILDGFTWTTFAKTNYTVEIDANNQHKATIKAINLPIEKKQFSFRLVHKNPTIGIERFSEQITAYLVTPKITLDVIDGYEKDNNIRVSAQNKAQIKVTIESTDNTFNFDPNKLQLKVRNQGIWENIGRVLSSDNAAKTAIMELTDLTPSEKYRIRCIYDGRYTSFNEGIFQTDGFHFEDWAATQTFSNVQYGGRIGWKKKSANFIGQVTSTSGYDGYETKTLIYDNLSDTYWTTTASKTIKSDFTPYNTWHMVPSVFKVTGQQGSGISLQSVAWDNKGTTVTDGNMGDIPEPSNPGWMSETINKNTRAQVPSTEITTSFKASGKLFLGQYSCIHDAQGRDPNETYTEKGLKLKTKPIGINFFYKFTSYNGDTGVVRAVVYDADNNQIGIGELVLSADVSQWEETNMLINYTNQAKADRITIMFASSSADKLPSLPTPEMQNAIKLLSDNITARNATGNLLSIDEVELKY